MAGYRTRYVTVTGGEPLAQKNCHALLAALVLERGYSVSRWKPSGAIDVSGGGCARPRAILDIRDARARARPEKNLWSNLAHLTARDEIKFVLCDEADYTLGKAADCPA